MSSATRLGHGMTSWVVMPTDRRLFVARCTRCDDLARVSVRDPHSAQISGPAVVLRCLRKRPGSAAADPAQAVHGRIR